MEIAKEFGGEIVSADSWTVYKGFDIGTSKPSPADQKAVKHYLIDVREATQGFSAPLFQAMAQKAIADIQKQGKLPILVGGTGLYIDSVLYDFGFLDNSTPEERRKLDSMELNELLNLAADQKIDLTDVDQRNKRRVVRAIEAKGQKPTKKQLRPNTLIIGLQLPDDVLRKKIERRVDQMVKAGFASELRTLSEKYGWDIEPMKGIGYRSFRGYIQGDESLDKAKLRFISGDIKLAKRQRTWFKRNPDIHWFDSAATAHQFIKTALNT